MKKRLYLIGGKGGMKGGKGETCQVKERNKRIKEG